MDAGNRAEVAPVDTALYETPASEWALDNAPPHEQRVLGAGGVAARLRQELEAMRTSALRRRAVAAGAEEDELEAADDGDDVRRALIELCVALELATAAEEETQRQAAATISVSDLGPMRSISQRTASQPTSNGPIAPDGWDLFVE
eukprot:SAG11_NODE_9959_length_866_cov_1.272490_1_plen_145_part_01